MFGKIFGACALGAAVGTALALELAPYLWWVGMLVGGLVGYFTYEFREVLRAARTAWKRTVAWRPFWLYWRVLCQTLAGCFIAPALLVGAGYLGQRVFFDPSRREMTSSLAALSTTILGACFFWLSMMGTENFSDLRFTRHFNDINGESSKKYANRNLRRWGIGLAIVILCSLIVFFCHIKLIKTILGVAFVAIASSFILALAVMFVVNKAVRIWKHRMVPVNFLWAFFKLVHSDIRLLCAVDAALGTAAGYAAGSALVGALAGGTLGVLNYYLVSVRWLKLAPASMNEKP